MNKIDRIIERMENLERLPLAIVTMVGPWLTPIIPAYFVAISIRDYLNAPLAVAVIAGLVLEVVGIAGIANSTRAYLWNQSKRKIDKPAPLGLSLAAVSVYFVTALLLTVALELYVDLAAIAPGMFIILSVSSGLILVLASHQRLRERRVAEDKLARKTKRVPVLDAGMEREKNGNGAGNIPAFGAFVTANTRERAWAILAERPDISGADLGRALGKSESLGRKLRAELFPLIQPENGKVKSNGH